jgi:hypothetical protein
MGEAAEDVWSQTTQRVTRAFRVRERENVGVQGEFDPKVDGGGPGDPIAKHGDVGMVMQEVWQLPAHLRDTLILAHAANGIIRDCKCVKNPLDEEGARRPYVEERASEMTPLEKLRVEKRKDELTPYERGQIRDKREAGKRLGNPLQITVGGNVPIGVYQLLAIEWADGFLPLEAVSISDRMGVSWSTVSDLRRGRRTRKGRGDGVHGVLDRWWREAIGKMAGMA